MIKDLILTQNPYLAERTKFWFPDHNYEIVPTVAEDVKQAVIYLVILAKCGNTTTYIAFFIDRIPAKCVGQKKNG